jgi:hypothetical protein
MAATDNFRHTPLDLGNNMYFCMPKSKNTPSTKLITISFLVGFSDPTAAKTVS